ncbi:MAG TPA: hypothetical protein VEU11_03840 [Terriglobales bacterium]|nr:hypothetical protein [Terriglobales bacterium]
MTGDDRWGRVAEVMFWLLAISYVGFLLSLGVFPSEDAPVHLYYADVLKDLMTGGNAYGHYFAVRHWLPPYALIYYLFIALDVFLTPLAADRVFVCLYTILLAGGFRYLLRVLNPRSTAMAVLIFPFVFNKFLYLGFYNFVLGLALALIVCAYWLRDPMQLKGWRRCWFLALVVLMLLTHPVPLLMAYLVMGLHLLALVITAAKKQTGAWSQRLWAAIRQCGTAIVALLLAFVPAFYVLLFVSGAGKSSFSTLAECLVKVRKLILFGPISPFQVWYYALPLGLIVFAVGIRALVLAWRGRMVWSQAQLTLLVSGAACALLYIVAPSAFSGGTSFDQRFPIFALLFTLAALASNAAFERGRCRDAILAGAIVISIASLVYQIQFCRHYQAAVDLYRAPAMRAGSKGAIVMDDTSMFLPPGLAFGPYRWVGAHYFRHSKAVLLNSPFLYTGTMPLKVAPSSLSPLNPLGTEISPLSMERLLAEGPIEDVDFVLFIGNTETLQGDNPLNRLCARYGLVKAWSTGIISMYARPASSAEAER